MTGIGLGTFLLNGTWVVECGTKHGRKNRLVGQTEHDSQKQDVDFDWNQFFQLLWPDIYSLALAIMVGTVLSVAMARYIFTCTSYNGRYSSSSCYGQIYIPLH